MDKSTFNTNKGTDVASEGKHHCDLATRKLAKELHKPVIRKFEKWKIHSSFIDNIWGADLADMQLLSNFNKRFWFLLHVIDIYSKYAWVVPLKDKKSITITNAF